MIERVNWPDRIEFDNTSFIDQLQRETTISPFDQDAFSRPLRITYHFESFKDLSRDEKEALDVLFEFSRTSLLEVLRVGGEGDFLPIKFGAAVDQNDYMTIEVNYGDDIGRKSVIDTTLLQDICKEITDSSKDPSISQEIYSDILCAHASMGMRQDICVTGSRWLLENRNHPQISDANPRTPLETLKLLGLLMRSRGDYRYASRIKCNQALYYQIFTFSKIPTLWRYYNAISYYPEKSIKYNIPQLASTIISRCVRAVQA
jgi:hypothetical protein